MRKILAFAAVAMLAFGTSATASPVQFVGADNGVSSLAQMVNSQAAAASFLAITGPINTVDFESAVPATLTIVGGSGITNNSGCGALCGFNTTSGGQNFELLFASSVTFSFTNPVDAFGFYVTGLQTDLVPQETIRYVDGQGNTQIVNVPNAINGGGAFVGFIDFGALISSVTFNSTNDIVAFDDLRFGRSAGNPRGGPSVPEPTSLTLLLVGGAGLVLRKALRK